MPIVFSHEIKNLKPQFFWMGGGHPDIKMRVSFEDFARTYKDDLIVDDITYEWVWNQWRVYDIYKPMYKYQIIWQQVFY